MIDDRPLIVTARLDRASFERLGALRRAHFPPERNHLPAHLTLFHHLPGEALDEVKDACRAALPATPIPLAFPRLRLLGRGVAVEVEAPDLLKVRAAIAARFADRLTPQDRQRLRPHVTVQNKVEPEAARALAQALAGEVPFAGACEGLLVWRYLGGPWGLEVEVAVSG